MNQEREKSTEEELVPPMETPFLQLIIIGSCDAIAMVLYAMSVGFLLMTRSFLVFSI
jgi:hypothetical protein